MPCRAAVPNCVPSHVGVLAMALASDIVLQDNTELLPRVRTALPIDKTSFTATISDNSSLIEQQHHPPFQPSMTQNRIIDDQTQAIRAEEPKRSTRASDVALWGSVLWLL